jgi:uncharacterized protein YbbK (DUF523 family)
MVRVLVSACLLGEKVRYNGAAATAGSPILTRWLAENRVVPFCPEVAGGLGVPRPAAELQHGTAADVLEGRAFVRTASGDDVTGAFVAGARGALERARREGARVAVLKDGSPSCASSYLYDGSFSGVRRPGAGVTADLLQRNGIRVFSERELPAADACVRQLETEPAVEPPCAGWPENCSDSVHGKTANRS